MTADRGSNLSDVELRLAVLDGWHRLVTSVQPCTDTLDTLAARTGMHFRELDMARRVRNQSAHQDQPVPRDRLLAASRIIEEAEQRLDPRRRRKPDGSNTPTPPLTAMGSQSVNRERLTSHRRLGLRSPAQRPTARRKQGGEPTRSASPRKAPLHLVLYALEGEESSQLIPLSDLGLKTYGTKVTCDASWLSGVITGDFVQLVAASLGTVGKQRGSARISSPDRSVKITIDLHVSPTPRQPELANPVDPAIPREAVWTVARVVFVTLAIVVLLFVALMLSSMQASR